MTITYNDTSLPHREPRTGILGGIGDFLSLVSRSIAAANAYETLSQMSDAQLAQRGLTRPDLANVTLKVLLDDS
jgi:hypothetical protein